MSRRNAAALLITKGEGKDLEILLCERAAELRFFGGYWALPGGTLAPEDWEAIGKEPSADDSEALQACALRELFEETGLLRHVLPSERATTDAIETVRTALLQRESDAAKKASKEATRSPFLDLVHGAAQPAPLVPLCRIETPAFSPVRYDTVFFHVPLSACTNSTLRDANGKPSVDVRTGELIQGRFVKPADALLQWRRGELLLVPPVVILCEHLAAATDFAAFSHAIAATTLSYREGALHEVRFSPGVVLAPLRTPTLPPATTTNCLVIGHKELWVVDPGSPHAEEQQRLERLLDQLCMRGAVVRGVLSTHHHPDHVGGIAALCRSRGISVRGHEETLSRLPEGCALGAPLRDGDTIDLGDAPDGSKGWTLRAMHTPGHDRGHLCFLESRYGAALVGDMLSTVSTIIIDPPEGHLATYLQSLERLLQEPLSTLYPAHGPALRDGSRLVKQYIRHRRQRETGLVTALQEGGGTVEQLLPKVYWDADQRLWRFAVRSLLAGLQKLEEEGRAAQHEGVWRAM